MAVNVNEDYAAHLHVSLSSSSNSQFQRKKLKACDGCRRRKIRCNGHETPGSCCSHCASSGIECKYGTPSNVMKRGSNAHIQDLEFRLANSERLLNLLVPTSDIHPALNPADKTDSYTTRRNTSPLSIYISYPDAPGTDTDSSDEGFPENRGLVEGENPMFWGKSSDARLVQFAMHSVNSATTSGPESRRGNVRKRHEYWDVQPWMKPPKEFRRVECNFPDLDLLSSLIGLYFTHINTKTPLLHHPIFERAVVNNLHHQDVQFAATVLLVCAIGARYSDDPRMTASPYDHPQSLCWIWFYQSQEMHQSVLYKPSLYIIQAYCLSAMFLEGCAPDYARWSSLGAAIRLAQDVGAHTRRTYGSKPTVQGELWKRAFWVLISLDRLTSAVLGRTSVQEEDFDLDLPIECDDEYWITEDPKNSFQQPPGLPSRVSYFVCMIKLGNIRAMAIRRICAIDKFKSHAQTDWNKSRLERLDGEMKNWIDSLPAHLRWDPTRRNSLYFTQSACLRAAYYTTQILAHQPFIGSHKFPSLSASSASTCSGAAKACVHLVDAARDRLGISLRPFIRHLFVCAVHLLQSIWHQQKDPDHSDEMKDVYTCMDILSSVENRWPSAGRLRDIIYGLITSNDLSNRTTALLDVNVHIPPMSATPQDQLRAYADSRRKRNIMNDMYMEYFPSDFLADGTAPPGVPNHTYDWNNQKKNSIAPVLDDSTTTEFRSHFLEPTLAAAFRMSAEPFQVNSPVGDLPGTQYSTSFDQTDEGFEMWSTLPSGNKSEDWDSYLHEIQEMVKGMQHSDG